MSRASGCIEDVGKRPKKLRNASKHARESSERRNPEDSPCRPEGEPYDPGGEGLIPGSVQSEREGPEGVRNERVDGTDAPTRDTGPGGHLEVQEESRGVEVDRDHQKVVDSAGHDGKRPKSEEDERGVDMNALRRVRGPRGHVDQEVESGDVGSERERESDGDGVQMAVIGCRMDSAMSGACCDLVQVRTRPLAGNEEGQHGRRNRTMDSAPKPSKPPAEYAIPPTDHVNPPRRRGRPKTRPSRVSPAGSRKSTHQAIRSRRDHIGQVGYIVYVVQGPGMVQE